MRGVFVRRVMIWSQRFNRQSLLSHRKPLCSNAEKPTNPNEIAKAEKPKTPSNEIVKAEKGAEPEFDPYKEIYNLDWDNPGLDFEKAKLDWEKAIKIMSSERIEKQKFGIDWHIVQFFICLLPSLACYLVAQYSRSQMKKYDAKFENKRKAQEEIEAKAKELELKAAAERVAANPVIVEVKERLDKLEGTIREVVMESKKQRVNLEDKSKLEQSKQEPTPTKPNSSLDNKHSSTATTKTSSNAEGDASK